MTNEELDRLRKAALLTPDRLKKPCPLWFYRSELSRLLEDMDELLPGELRRVAELVELLLDDEAARPWWEKAREAGDLDARDYLKVLDEEEN